MRDPEPPPVFRHSIAWSLAAGAFAFTLVFYAWGTAYVGGHSHLGIASLLTSAAILGLGGAAYAGFLLSRRPRRPTSLALAPLAVLINIFSLALDIAAAVALRW